jgi:hypothetical protein
MGVVRIQNVLAFWKDNERMEHLVFKTIVLLIILNT